MIGIGAPCIDFIGKIEENALKNLPGRKGDSILVNKEQLQEAFSAISPEGLVTLTGGCSANTMKGLASLGAKVSFCGRIGSDPLSEYFRSVFKKSGITSFFTISNEPIQQVVSLVTPDGQRTCYCYAGAMGEFKHTDLDAKNFRHARLVYIEGYSLYQPGVVKQAIAYAKAAGAKVAMGLNSRNLVDIFKNEILGLIEGGDVDILFCNADEMYALAQLLPKQGVAEVSGKCKLAVVTVGKEGCWVGEGRRARLYAGYPANVVDTTGAGDLFAAGFLYGYLQEQPAAVCADWGNLAGSAAVQRVGAELPPEVWGGLKARMRG